MGVELGGLPPTSLPCNAGPKSKKFSSPAQSDFSTSSSAGRGETLPGPGLLPYLVRCQRV